MQKYRRNESVVPSIFFLLPQLQAAMDYINHGLLLLTLKIFASLVNPSVTAQMTPSDFRPLVQVAVTHLLHLQMNAFFSTMPFTALWSSLSTVLLSFSKLSFATMLPRSLATARSVVC